MLVNPAANATADTGRAVSSRSVFARWTRRVVATAVGEAPAWRRNSRRRWRAVIPSVSASSSTRRPSSRNPASMSRSARETLAAAPRQAGVPGAASGRPLIAALGFPRALVTAGLGSFGVVIAAALLVMRRGPHTLGLGPDGEPAAPALAAPRVVGGRGSRGDALRTWRFWSVSAPLALGLAAQVGVLTHLVGLVGPTLGPGGAARAVATTTATALVGRLLTGVVVDRVNRRVVASATLGVQMLGLALLATAPSAAAVYAGCVLFGLGVGNLTTLPGLILAREWPRERFAALVGLAVGINQLTFAFGPSLVGVVRDRAGSYAPALAACAALQAAAAAMILLGPRRPRAGGSARP